MFLYMLAQLRALHLALLTFSLHHSCNSFPSVITCFSTVSRHFVSTNRYTDFLHHTVTGMLVTAQRRISLKGKAWIKDWKAQEENCSSCDWEKKKNSHTGPYLSSHVSVKHFLSYNPRNLCKFLWLCYEQENQNIKTKLHCDISIQFNRQ